MFVKYIFKRLLSIVPALFALSLFVFLLKSAMPDNVVENRVNAARIQNSGISQNDFTRIVKEIRSNLKLDRPMFYFSVKSSVLPDSLIEMYPVEQGEFLKGLLLRYGTNQEVVAYYQTLQNTLYSTDQRRRKAARNLYGKLESEKIKLVLNQNNLKEEDQLMIAYRNLLANSKPYESLMPTVRWYGVENQFHYWFKSVVTFDFGRSIVDNGLVSKKIIRALWNTLLITLPALLILLIISIPLGAWVASGKGTVVIIVRTLLFSLDAIPLFWLALLLIILFASGVFLNVLPAYGMGAFQEGSDFSLFEKMRYLILPITTLVFAAMGYLTIQVMKAINDEQGKLYVLAARARGLPEFRILWVHIFKNSLIPIITIFSQYLTAAFAGSLVVEVIFSIPGMGKLLYDSVLGRDFNVIIGVILLIGLIKMVSNMLADLGYKLVNPTITYS